ncbi:MAG: hypothetical protein AB8I08_12095 [Sandaracinaceae bacterium]
MLLEESAFSFHEFCDQVLLALDDIEPYWREYVEVDDVLDWLSENWPLPTHTARDPSSVARYCLADMEEAQLECFANVG